MSRRVSRSDIQRTEIQKEILSMSGKYTAYEIFSDWIECIALAISNSIKLFQDELWRKREEQYCNVIKKYTEQERLKLSKMVNMLIKELEDNPRDVLGEVFMLSGMGADVGGQFFTPFSISRMMASINVVTPKEGEKITLSEPSCGSGGSIIAAAIELKKRGINYQNCMEVVAQDIDWRCVYMCYVQLSFLGINAICVQGDTLLEPYTSNYSEYRILRTPKAMGVF